MNDGLTHSATCWSWGQQHYGCAIGEIGRLRAEADRLRGVCDRLRNALARTHYDLSSADALLVADLKAWPVRPAQD